MNTDKDFKMQNDKDEEKKKRKGLLWLRLGEKSKKGFIKTKPKRIRKGFIPFLWGRGAADGLSKAGLGKIAGTGFTPYSGGLGWILNGVKGVLANGKLLAGGIIKFVTTTGGALIAGLAVTGLAIATGLYLNSTKSLTPDYYMGSGFNETGFKGSRKIAKKISDVGLLDRLVNSGKKASSEDLGEPTDASEVIGESSLTGEQPMNEENTDERGFPKPQLKPETFSDKTTALNLNGFEPPSERLPYKSGAGSVMGSMNMPDAPRAGRLEVMGRRAGRQAGNYRRTAAAMGKGVYGQASAIRRGIANAVSGTNSNYTDVKKSVGDLVWTSQQDTGNGTGITVDPVEIESGGGGYMPGSDDTGSGAGGDTGGGGAGTQNYDPFLSGDGSYYTNGTGGDGIIEESGGNEPRWERFLQRVSTTLDVGFGFFSMFLFVVTAGVFKVGKKKRKAIANFGKTLVASAVVMGAAGQHLPAVKLAAWGALIISISKVSSLKIRRKARRAEDRIKREADELRADLDTQMLEKNEPLRTELEKHQAYKDYLESK